MTSLNIKDEEAYLLAKEIAERNHTSMTKIVVETLRERAAKERKRQSRGESTEEFVERWMKMTARPDRDPNEPDLSITHGDLLYDEDGLPR